MIALLLSCRPSAEVSDVDPTPLPPEEEVTADSADTDAIHVRSDPGLLSGQEEPELFRFAVIGDYGVDDADAAAVAALVTSWAPDFILTLGDNNYYSGGAETLDANVGQYYSAWIYPYLGKYGEGATENRFWPCPGNHDWYTKDMTPYLDYFTLPGNERYYEVEHEGVHVFCVDSDPSEPDGTSPDSIQGQWLKEALAASTADYKIVYMHHPPYSSGSHGDNIWMQWPLWYWGADLVLGGHDHTYERQVRDGIPFLVNGLGGANTYTINEPDERSQMAFNSAHGASLMRAMEDGSLLLEAWTTDGGQIDQVRIRPDQPLGTSYPLLLRGADWQYTTADPGEGWTESSFDDSAWSTAAAPVATGGTEAWLRHRFTVADAGRINALTIEIDAATASVSLNGTPLLSHTRVEDGFALYELSSDGLLTGTNVLAVEVSDGKEATLDLGVVGTGGQVLLSMTSDWLLTVDAPADTWKQPTFDTTTWDSITAPLDWPVAKDTGAPLHSTAWLRHSFTIDDPAAVADLLLEVSRADGVALYLNGTLIHRSNLYPDGGALSAVQEAWVSSTLSTLVRPSLLRSGENVLAAEVHRFASGPLHFQAQLTGF